MAHELDSVIYYSAIVAGVLSVIPSGYDTNEMAEVERL